MSAHGLVAAGPRPKELWLTAALSVLLHGVFVGAVILAPKFRVGSYVTVPVSYTVNLVSAEPSARAPAPTRASTPPPARPSAPPPAPPPPAAPPRAAAPPAPPARTPPPPQPVARPSEELTLPAKRVVPKAPPEVESSLRLPTPAVKTPVRPASPEARPRPPAVPATPAAPVAPVVPLTPPVPVAPATPGPAVAPAGPSTASATNAGAAKTSGVELANGERGEGSGGSALGYYLGLVDYKISTNWTPIASGGAKESVVVIRFRVLRSGNVRDIELETSSGEAGVDTAALRAIRQSVPLPPFPNLLTDPFLNLRYRFVMERG